MLIELNPLKWFVRKSVLQAPPVVSKAAKAEESVMKFDMEGFLSKLVQIAPAIVVGSITLAKEAGSATKAQLAQDSLSLATGVTDALGSSDPKVVASANAASSLIGAVITALTTHYTQSGVVTTATS